jgi:branched-chain amino acid transport system substrate-binding protein
MCLTSSKGCQMTNLHARRGIIVLAAVLFASACGASPGSGTEESTAGVSETALRIGIHGPKSGPAAALTEGIISGFRLYIEDINTKGGIDGREIEIVEADDQYSVSGGAAAARQITDDTLLGFNLVGADPAIGALPEFERTGTPYLSVALPLELAQDSDVAYLFPTPLELLGATVPSFVQSELDAGEDATIGLMYENQDVMIDMKDHFMQAAKDIGLEVVIEERFDRDAANYVPNVQRVKAAGADLVVLIGGVGVPGVLKAADSIGYAPTFTGAGAWTFNLFHGVSGGLMEGVRAVRSSATTDLSDYEEFLSRLRATGSKESPLDELAYAGWVDAKFLEQILLRIDGNPSREKLLELLSSGELKDEPIEIEGLPAIWYSEERHYGSDEAVPSVVKDGVWVSTGDPAADF